MDFLGGGGCFNFELSELNSNYFLLNFIDKQGQAGLALLGPTKWDAEQN